MRNLFLPAVLFFSLSAFSSDEVGPEGSSLIWFVLLLLLFLFSFLVLPKSRSGNLSFLHLPFLFSSKRIRVILQKDKKYRPKILKLVVTNNSQKDTDLEAPVLIFRKLLLTRKFKLTGVNHSAIYPLYLEAGKVHELWISLSIFHKYDRKLKGYYWSRILIQDTHGRKYTSKYITLRKSLFS